MSLEARHVVCPHCDAVNRLPAGRPAQAAKCGRCHQALFTGAPLEVSGAGLHKHVRSNQIPVVVDFWAPWCGPCRMMAPAYAQAARELEPQIRFLKLNTEEDQAVAQQFNIRSIPTLILFRNGEVAARMSGALDGPSLRQWIASHAA
ncbi:MAG: thioredoxin TrxC [Alphaproteobacteria bacterium]|nr:thioredoxin TrxC [Alphaproteobacteria bacterium]